VRRGLTPPWLAARQAFEVVHVSTGIRGSDSRGCRGCARSAARTSCLDESCSDRASHTLIVGTGGRAGIPMGPATPRGNADSNGFADARGHVDSHHRAVPTVGHTHRDAEQPSRSDRQMVQHLPEMPPAGPIPRTGRPAWVHYRRGAWHERSRGGWYACCVPHAARSARPSTAATNSRRVLPQASALPRHPRPPFPLGVIAPAWSRMLGSAGDAVAPSGVKPSSSGRWTARPQAALDPARGRCIRLGIWRSPGGWGEITRDIRMLDPPRRRGQRSPLWLCNSVGYQYTKQKMCRNQIVQLRPASGERLRGGARPGRGVGRPGAPPGL